MSKLLKSGMFGIVCAMTMMNVEQVRAGLNEDYQAIKTAIKEYKSQYTPVTNALNANPDVSKKIGQCKQRCFSITLGGSIPQDAKRPDYIQKHQDEIKRLEESIGITAELKEEQRMNIKNGLTKVTFGKLKSMVSNEYISSIDSAVSTHLPNVDISEYDVIVDMEFGSRLAGAKKMDDGWIVFNNSSTNKLTKGNIGFSIERDRVFLYDPAKVFPEKIDITPYEPSKVTVSSRRRVRRSQPK